ncbi:MAG: effector binding domain-containing protein [Thermomicrobiales bacterium]
MNANGDVIRLVEAFTVVGIELRTDNTEAMRTIPPFWGRFFGEEILARIPDRVDGDVYAVYTNFAHPGIDNEGTYSLVIGARVAEDTTVPEGMIAVGIPASARVQFAVDGNDPGRVGEAWATSWARTDLRKTYLADYEHYAADGTIAILVGVEGGAR